MRNAREQSPPGWFIFVATGMIVLGVASAAHAQLSISLQQVISGLNSPVYLTHAGDGSNRLFVVEQPGRILIYKSGALLGTPFLDIRSKVGYGGERGLLSVAFHPQYASNRRFFVYYTRSSDGDIVLSEFAASTGNPDIADPAETVLLVIEHSTYSNHNGGQLQFGPDGYLYLGTGDGGGGGDPLGSGQNINTLLGKILRIDVNLGSPYAIPPGNPFAGIAGLDEIYALGLRNPWRFSFDRLNGTLYAGDVGQGAREEVDIITLGGNFGWNTMEGTQCYSPPSNCNMTGLTLPIAEYAHSGGNCSVTGGYVYRGSQSVDMFGTYLYGDYCTGIIWGYSGGVATQLLDTSLSISSFGEDQSGEIYLVSLSGTVNRIVGPTGGSCALTCPADITVTDEDRDGSEVVEFSAPTSSGTCGSITCLPASGSAFPVGTTTVTCTSAVGGGVCSFGVTVLPGGDPLQITSISPSSGKRGEELEVFVRGTGFEEGAASSFGRRVLIRGTERHSANELHVTLKIRQRAQRAKRNVVVRNPDGASAACSGCFRVK